MKALETAALHGTEIGLGFVRRIFPALFCQCAVIPKRNDIAGRHRSFSVYTQPLAWLLSLLTKTLKNVNCNGGF